MGIERLVYTLFAPSNLYKEELENEKRQFGEESQTVL